MAVDSAVWKLSCNYDPLTGQYQDHSTSFIDGDTIINNISYHKVYSLSTLFYGKRLSLLIRDNIFTNTVHGIYLDSILPPCTPFSDVVLFDFNSFVTAGTQVSNCEGIYDVFQVDTINIYGMDRRVFYMNFGNWIEGVGSNSTALYPGHSSNCTLVNYCRGTPEDCGAYAWVSTKDIRSYQTGKLYPNPTRTQSRLELEAYLENGKIQVFNLLGQLQHEQYFSGQEAIIDVSNLNQGMYMIQVFDNEQLVFGEKLMVVE